MKLDNKIAVITGGNSGMGLSMAPPLPSSVEARTLLRAQPPKSVVIRSRFKVT